MADSSSKEQPDLAKVERSVQELLNFCASNEFEVPQELKDSLKSSLSKKSNSSNKDRGTHEDFLHSLETNREPAGEDALIAQVQDIMDKLQSKMPNLDLRVKDGKYVVTNYFEQDPNAVSEEEDTGRAKQQIKTIVSEGPLPRCLRAIKRCFQNKGDARLYSQQKTIVEGFNLIFEPGKMYLVLGGPGSGKSTLLKMIADILHKSKDCQQSGVVSLSGVSPSKDVVWSSLVGYIDQIDRLHAYLTVFETCEFAWRCRTGGTSRRPWFGEGPEVDATIAEMDEDLTMIKLILDAIGLTRVKDTFVGDQQKVRGVSGGEKKRVTVAEMMAIGAPLLCCDEISTGLDAATTYDITRRMGEANRITNAIKIVSLLQPPPETVANFDELVVLSEGMIIYSGPLDDVIEYFNSIGYEIPERMDVADWLQALPTKDGVNFLKNGGGDGDEENQAQKHLTPKEFSDRFYASDRGKAILASLDNPLEDPAAAEEVNSIGASRYANSAWKSFKLLSRRELLLWWRDKYQIKAKIVQTTLVGIVVGTLFWQTESPNSIMSVLFQTMFYACLAQMTLVLRQFPERSIFYKQQDANFYPTWAYVAGRGIATTPIATIDAIFYGTIIYFFVGLAYNDGANISNYFMFLLITFSLSLTTGLFFSVYSATVRVVTKAQALMALTAIVFVLFSGFTVQPDVIPPWYIWVYWLNFFSWALRALAVNEFDSGKYDDEIVPGSNVTEGEQILTTFGFTLNGEPYTKEWRWYGFLFTLFWGLLSMLASTFFLTKIRYSTGGSLVTDQGTDEVEVDYDASEEVAIPFKRVDLTFKNIHYTVVSSITNEKLELLKGIDGVVESGKMTALMGSSGAGKTTLMDVLALRKSSGDIEGEVRLNGHLQEEISFRRCTGYVEQFDVQSAELTIRETVQFSAKLRLEETDPAVTDESIDRFVDQTLNMLELTNLQDLQIGSDETGGLSFEQKKRLSIAVELVANPSILFLDEPTSGLDARAASIVMRGLSRIAKSGRAVCATIHQPSVAIFSDFETLLLLKRGGEVVFYGELGEHSQKLINYLEGYDATKKIQPGENPATWMLTTIGAGSADTKPFDYAGNYVQSKLHSNCLEKIETICSGETEENKVSFQSRFATSLKTQKAEVFKRMVKIYYRCPAYNTTRMMISGLVALLFSTVYIRERTPTNESTLNSIMNSIYIAVLFLAVNAQNTVLPVFELERNMFYRHKAAGMYSSAATVRAFTLAEVPFIFVGTTIFVMIFYWIMGFRAEAAPFFWFWLYYTLTMATFTYLGQMLASLFRDAQTAQGFGALIIMSCSLFGGILIRPSEIPNFWIFMYWLMPGHYFFEGLIMSQYYGDTTVIEATPGSTFWDYLGCPYILCPGTEAPCPCYGTAGEWVASSFTDWSYDNVKKNLWYLVGVIILSRLVTFYALNHINYRST